MAIFNLFKPDVSKLERNKNVKGLIKALKYKHDIQIQDKAEKALCNLGRSAEEMLIKIIFNELEDYAVRERTLRVGIAVGSIEAIRLKFYFMRCSDEFIEKSLETIFNMKNLPDGTERILDSVIEKNEDKLYIIRSVIINIGKKAVPTLIRTFKYAGKGRVRERVVDILGDIGDSRAATALANALDDKHNDYSDMHIKIMIALGKLGDSRAVEAISNSMLKLSQRADARLAAINALAEIGDNHAVEPLVTIMSGAKYYHKDGWLAAEHDFGDDLRREAYGALKKITKKDFGYDAKKWLDWLKEANSKGEGLPIGIL